MSRFEISSLQNSSVWGLYRMRDRIETDPDYQRQSDIWTRDKRQLLIDSIINRLDVPKLYLHKFISPKEIEGKMVDYAIIDGKQRLQAIWDFIEGKFSLSENFEYLNDENVIARNMKYAELGKTYPDLKTDFDSFTLSVICIETKDIEMIEELFSRLNEAVPLSASEKRNALGGPIPVAIRKISNNDFFTSCLPFGNSRYRHFDLAAKFLYAETMGKVVDTKKVYLDRFVEDHVNEPRNQMPTSLSGVETLLAKMREIFDDRDPLLKQIGMVMLYFHVFRLAKKNHWVEEITRSKLAAFESSREENREKAKLDLAEADYELVEFDKYTQSPNDGYAIKIRLSIFLSKVFNKELEIETRRTQPSPTA